jgi:hypothetical protein
MNDACFRGCGAFGCILFMIGALFNNGNKLIWSRLS